MGLKVQVPKQGGFRSQKLESAWFLVPRLWESRFSILEYKFLLVPEAIP